MSIRPLGWLLLALFLAAMAWIQFIPPGGAPGAG